MDFALLQEEQRSHEPTFRSSPCLQISPGNPLSFKRTPWTTIRAHCHQHGSWGEPILVMATLCGISEGWWQGWGFVGTPSFSVQRSLGHPLGSSLHCLSEPESPYSMDLSPPAPKQSLSLPKSLVGSQDVSLSISPWQWQCHSVSLPPWWERPSH